MANSKPHRPLRIIALAAITLAWLTACQGENQTANPLASYTFVQLVPNQQVGVELQPSSDTTLLVRVEGHEVVFESRLLEADGEVLSSARLPYLRVGPVFHLLEPSEIAGSQRVSIQPGHLTRNASVKVQVSALPMDSKSDTTRVSAFKNYIRATQSTEDESPELWSERVNDLRSAASGFKQSGDAQMQLWSEYLQAYFLYYPLAQNQEALLLTRAVEERAKALDDSLIEMMALQLAGQILVEQAVDDSTELVNVKSSRAQEVLKQAVELADQFSLPFEKAWATNTRGIGYFYQDDYAEAEVLYREALEQARELEDKYLQYMVRGNLALVHERQGNLTGALASLREINRYLEHSGTKADLAHNWSELSRLYLRLFLIPQSIEAESKALDLWQDLESAEGQGRSLLSLAHAYQGMGQNDMALNVVREAISFMQTANHARGMREGYRLLANLYRSQGRFSLMEEARNRQQQNLGSLGHEARFQYDLGLDELAQSPDEPLRAVEIFSAAKDLAIQSRQEGIGIRSQLQICANSDSPGDDRCAGPVFEQSLNVWLLVAPPSQALEARYLLAQHYSNLGRPADAALLLTELIDEIALYQQSLPGILGAWYWESRLKIFRDYMSHYLQLANPDQRALESLLALDRLLNTSRNTVSRFVTQSGDAPPATGKLRDLLAQLESGDVNDRTRIRQAIDRELLSLRGNSPANTMRTDGAVLAELLDHLPADSALLAYYFAPNEEWAWLAGPSGIRLVQISESNRAAMALRQASRDLRTVGHPDRQQDLDSLGDLLLAPFGEDLPRIIWLLPVGELAGFPFDVIRHRGRYFGQDHELINLGSLSGLENSLELAGTAQSWRKILLAGDPLGNGTRLPRAAREIDDIANLFDSLDVHRVTGGQLNMAILQNPVYSQADLFHFAGHGQINLPYPELSRLLLSDGPNSGVVHYMTPLDIRGAPVKANLVVLSACETTGLSPFTFDANLGFVSEFLQAGAGSVVASLWPVSDVFAGKFMPEFYRSIIHGMNPAQALAHTKRRTVDPANAATNLEWASFQLYIK